MQTRSHADRLRTELNEIRAELVEAVSPISADALNLVPREGMRSIRDLLNEIATMEIVCIRFLATGSMPEWGEAATEFAVSGDGQDVLVVLNKAREETLAYLSRVSEDELETLVAVPESWHQYMGTHVEPEEIVRWVTRSEYYHLGQIIIHRWLQGFAP